MEAAQRSATMMPESLGHQRSAKGVYGCIGRL
jgi:hypothetical protein